MSAPIRFSEDDLDLFGRASKDQNPLHHSDLYARKTPFGERVVFGVLGALAGLGRLDDGPKHVLAGAVFEFSSPMFVGIDYAVKTGERDPEKSTVKMYDGKRLVSRANARFLPSNADPFAGWEPAGRAPAGESALFPALAEAADLGDQTFAPGFSVAGRYSPDWERLAALAERHGFLRKGIGPSHLACLLGCSYVVGMRLPGKGALFSRLAIRWDRPAAGLGGALSYEVRVVSFDPRFHLLSLSADFRDETSPVSHADIQVFARQDIPVCENSEIEELLPRSERLKGKVALVVGASRGLGASLAQALALQGCTVVASFHRSRGEAEALEARLAGAPGRLILSEGDAADPAWCRRLAEGILRELGRLDLLVCNACPPLLPLWLEPASISRVNDYVARSLALVSAPMSAFLASLAETAGWCVVVSSSAVVEPPPEWPHYVSAKLAIEGLARVAAREFAGVGVLIARPPRLLTTLTHSPLSHHEALPTARVAARVVARLLGPAAPGRVEVLDDFASPP